MTILFNTRNTILVVVLLAFAPLALAQEGIKLAPKRTLIRAGRVLNVKTGELLRDQALVINGDRIEKIVPAAGAAPLPGWTVIEERVSQIIGHRDTEGTEKNQVFALCSLCLCG